jgi:hypothetical protein
MGANNSHRLLHQPAKSLGCHQPGQLISLHLHLAIGCLPTYDCIVSGWRENLRESLSQTGTAVIFHPAHRIVNCPFFWVRFKPTFRVLGFWEHWNVMPSNSREITLGADRGAFYSTFYCARRGPKCGVSEGIPVIQPIATFTATSAMILIWSICVHFYHLTEQEEKATLVVVRLGS